MSSRAGEALRRAALRKTATDPAATLLREREETVDTLRQLAVLERVFAQRDGSPAAREVERLRGLKGERARDLSALDARLTALVPSFSVYVRPPSMTLAAARAVLDRDAAAIMTLITEDGLLVWMLTQDDADAALLPLTAKEMAGLVRRVRAGVDLLAVNSTMPTFDLEAAQRIYAAVIGPALGRLAGKQRIVLIPDGPLPP
jgi:hypothetical protein